MTVSENTFLPAKNLTWNQIVIEERAREEVEKLRAALIVLMEDKARQENINSLLTKVTK